MRPLCLLAFVTMALAAVRPQTPRTRSVGDLKVEPFSRGLVYETFGPGISHPSTKRADEDLKDAVLSYAQSRLGVDHAKMIYRKGYTTDVASYGYIDQVHDGIPFANSVVQVSFNRNNSVVAFGSTWKNPSRLASSKPEITDEQARATAEKTLEGKYRDAPILLRYLVTGNDVAVLTYVVEVQGVKDGKFYEAYIDAAAGEVVNVVGLTENSSYLVVPYGKVAPPDGFETIRDPDAPIASTFPDINGWPNPWVGSAPATRGHWAVTSFLIPQSQDNQVFNWPWDPSTDPQSLENACAVNVQAFYLTSKLHDVLYAYGWTETTFNYQMENWGRGGAENDPIRLYVQSPNTPNNSGFSQRRDGLESQIDLGLFYYTEPARDAGFAADFVAHEYGHGLSHRLIEAGGENCLTELEARGLGEGWSDALASWTLTSSVEVKDWVFGAWVGNRTEGFRTHPYSTSTVTNPLKYSDILGLDNPHPIGEVWANMLHNIYAGLVKQHGYSLAARDGDASSTAGNAVYMHLIIDSLQLTPCQPTFIAARDAFIQADVNRYKGTHRCLIWSVFAQRGLGVNAKVDGVDNFDKPTDCA